MSFVHLHVHSHFSLLDGVLKIEEIVEFAKKHRMPAVALTDHGNLFGAVSFMRECSKADIKGILGSELYFVEGDHTDRERKQPLYHATVLVKNAEGYRNLLKLVSLAYLEGFYYKPRVSLSLLEKHGEGLIVLSGCMSGAIPTFLKSGNYQKAEEIARRLKERFGDDFYIEVMDHGLADQKSVLPRLVELARKLDISLVATNDVHYLHRGDHELQDVLLCISTGKVLEDDNRMRMDSQEFYLKTSEEMERVFCDLPEALHNTLAIAEKVHFVLGQEDHSLPHFPLPEGFSSINHYFKQKAQEGLRERLREKKEKKTSEEQYWKRLEHELNVIMQMNFPSYFLIVADIIDFARKNQIPVGPGRGSAAGSLVSYALRITDVDPLDFGLLFERFLNQERISLPDIDVDFCQRERGRVIQYIKEKYGENNVAQIVTFNSLKAKSVVRDVARVLGLSYQEGDAIAKLIPTSDFNLRDSKHWPPRLKEMAEKSEEVEKVLELGARLQGLHRNISVHAAGVVITPDEVTQYVPLCLTPKGDVVTQYDKNMLEYLNLLKMDILGLRTLTVISDTLRTIPDPLDLSSIPLDDKATYQLFSEGKTDGVFQFESDGMKGLLRDAQPSRLEDLVALNALYRPGALQSNMVQEFIDRKKGRKPIRYMTDALKDILEETYGIIVYQEQVMQIAVTVAGYSMNEADKLRKAMGKKLPEIMQAERKRFTEGAIKQGYSKKVAQEIFDFIEPFAGYGFNKSHSVAYALIAYQTAYLKTHYPLHYMASLLTSEVNNTDKLAQYIQECQRMAIPIYPPDVQASHAQFTVEREGIRFGLSAIKGLGENMAEVIAGERERSGAFRGLVDFLVRLGDKGLNKKVLEALACSGALDSFGYPRRHIVENLGFYQEMASRILQDRHSGQLGLFGSEGSEHKDPQVSIVEEYEELEKLKKEHEALGLFLSGHPLEKHKSLLQKVVTAPLKDIHTWKDRVVTIGGIITQYRVMKAKSGANKGKAYARFTIEDLTGQVHGVLFPDLYQTKGALLDTEDPVLVTGTIRGDEVSVECIVSDIFTLEEGKNRRIREIIVDIPHPVQEEQLHHLRDFILKNRGSIPVLLRYTKPGFFHALIEPDIPFRLKGNPTVFQWLQDHWGEENYHVIYG